MQETPGLVGQRTVPGVGERFINEDQVGKIHQKEGKSIHGYRHGREMSIGHPGCQKRDQRDREQMSEVGPDEPWSSLFCVPGQVMMIYPNDCDKEVTDEITDPCRPQPPQGAECCSFRPFKIEDHEGNDDSKDAVAERIYPSEVRCIKPICGVYILFHVFKRLNHSFPAFNGGGLRESG